MEGSQERSGGTAIAVALITVLGGVATGVLTNWDRIFGSSPAAQAPANAVPAKQDPAPAPGNPVAPAPAAAAPAAAGDGAAAAEPVTQAAVESLPSIAGFWRDNDGLQVQLMQQGSEFGYRQILNGIVIGEGAGRLNGRTIAHWFRFTNGAVIVSGNCRGSVQSDSFIDEICEAENGARTAFQLRR